MSTLASSFSILAQPGVFVYLLRGIAFTCIISVLGVILGLILGSLLALARTYCKKGPARILGWLSAAYIELFRNTPYLLWIFVCVVFCPCPAFFAHKMFGLTSVEMKLLFKAALALILFNSSVIAEIVRGGLNGVAKGQFEAGYAQGFNTAEVLLYIILPQAHRNIIPELLRPLHAGAAEEGRIKLISTNHSSFHLFFVFHPQRNTPGSRNGRRGCFCILFLSG